MTAIALKLVLLVNVLEICTPKRFHEYEDDWTLVIQAQESFYYNHSGWPRRNVSWHEGHHCECDQLIAKFNIATGDDVPRRFNEFELSHVGSWHTLNRRHCRLALMWNTFCEKSICLARCDRERKQKLAAEVWARSCADHWQGEADKFKKSKNLSLTDEFREETYSQKQIDLWMKKVVQTFPPCEVCVEPTSTHKRQEVGLPDACKKENNVHIIVGELLDTAMPEDTRQLSGNKTNVDSHHNWSLPSHEMVPEYCQEKCSRKAQELDQIWTAPVGNRPTEQLIYDAIDYTWVKGWHFMNKMHCHVALANLRWCQRNSCYRRCQESLGKPKSQCKATWESNYTEGVARLRQKTFDELMARNIPRELAHRWWVAVVRTFEVCAPCTDKSPANLIPQPCWHEYNTYAEVWFQSLPENEPDHHREKTMMSKSRTFYCVILGVAIVVSVYCFAQKAHNWVSRSRVHQR